MQKKKSNPPLSWELISSKTALPSLKLGGKWIHSQFDPLKEAQSFVKKWTKLCEGYQAVLIGRGLDYIPQAWEQQSSEPLIVWDPFPEISQQLPIVESKSAVIQKVEELQSYSKLKLIHHPGYQDLTLFESKQAACRFTKQAKSLVISQRSLESLQRLPSLGNFDQLHHHEQDSTIVLCGAGPSLHDCLPALKKAHNCTIMTALQATPILQKHNIPIKYVTIADPQDLSPFLKDCQTSFQYLLADSSCHPNMLDWIPHKTALFHLDCDQAHDYVWNTLGFSVIQEPFATVSEVMLNLALQMGARRIILLGMDYSWQETRYTYRSKGFIANSIAADIALQNNYKTDSDYFHGFRYMNHQIPTLSKPIEILRYTHGPAIQSCQHIALQDLSKYIQNSKTSINKTLQPIQNNQQIAQALEQAQLLSQTYKSNESLALWNEFAMLPDRVQGIEIEKCKHSLLNTFQKK